MSHRSPIRRGVSAPALTGPDSTALGPESPVSWFWRLMSNIRAAEVDFLPMRPEVTTTGFGMDDMDGAATFLRVSLILNAMPNVTALTPYPSALPKAPDVKVGVAYVEGA